MRDADRGIVIAHRDLCGSGHTGTRRCGICLFRKIHNARGVGKQCPLPATGHRPANLSGAMPRLNHAPSVKVSRAPTAWLPSVNGSRVPIA